MASLTWKGVQLYDTADPPTRRFWITENGPLDVDWDVRGDDDIISSAPGRTARNRVKDVFGIIADGYINGTGATVSAQQTNFYATLATLDAVLQTDGSIGALVWVAPNGTTYTVQARFLRRSRSDWQAGVFRRYTLEWESIDWLASCGSMSIRS
jgi:hypothetical protein